MRNFKEYEFACRCGCERHVDKMNKDFMKTLDWARDLADTSFQITSAYRCPAYNMSIGSKSTSSHVKGQAVDIYTPDNYVRMKVVKGLIEAGVQRIGVGPYFVHADNDLTKPFPRMWDYYEEKENNL